MPMKRNTNRPLVNCVTNATMLASICPAYSLPSLHAERITLDNVIRNSTPITQREYQCLMHLLDGKSTKQIGLTLKISYRTIEKYISMLKIKFGCRTTIELVCKIYRLCLLEGKNGEYSQTRDLN